ncbi:Acyl dehydratase [Archaeoglobus sulfaticallidus PM70-1]|uniref:Acyl dehydratase n=1 Tax=Archaeoglobus sulfaticallidus PM70-1 TaxID=387631 RepID=N0BI74_9EURY|nr:MaoC family dehydratase [Archaeoglobus sulfaticallidus]AGK61987.1 Acyl dehydratase [Archaeoglobus sulfaticallidus PM70-1]
MKNDHISKKLPDVLSQIDPEKHEKLILEIIKNLYSKIAEFKIGQKTEKTLSPGLEVTFEKRLTYADVFLFSLISGDWNVIHHSEEIAKRTKFGGRVVHGLLTTSLASALMEMLPGIVVLLSVEFQYIRPVYVGDTVRGKAVVVDRLPGNRLRVEVKFINERNEVVVKGNCMVLVWDSVNL